MSPRSTPFAPVRVAPGIRAAPVARVVLAACAALACVGCELDRDVDVSAAPPLGSCFLSVTPGSIDYGLLPIGTQLTQTVTLQNRGTELCTIAQLALAPTSDAEFTLDAAQSQTLSLNPGASEQLAITFTAQSRQAPHTRTGTLLVDSNDPIHASQSVALSADIDLGCDLDITPNPFDFGNIALNIVQTDPLVIENDGTRDCLISDFGLAPGTDADFSLPQDQATQFTLVPGASVTIQVTFDATSPPPNLRTGAIDFQLASSDHPTPAQGVIPLEGYIDTNCTAASQLIYTVDDVGNLASFDPDTLQFTQIGALNCPTDSTTFSMSVDQLAVAWVEYQSGELFHVDTSNAACTATSFQPNQDGFFNFGMGFLFEPTTGIDTLYIAGGQQVDLSSTQLGTISFPSLEVHPIGTITLGWPELTGTGDGQLWGFVPSFGSVSGVATLAQIDPATGKILTAWTYPEINAVGGWAMKFWGGSFWIFLGNSVYSVSRDTAALQVALDGTSPEVVGAGVSTCAPLRPTRGTTARRRQPETHRE